MSQIVWKHEPAGAYLPNCTYPCRARHRPHTSAWQLRQDGLRPKPHQRSAPGVLGCGYFSVYFEYVLMKTIRSLQCLRHPHTVHRRGGEPGAHRGSRRRQPRSRRQQCQDGPSQGALCDIRPHHVSRACALGTADNVMEAARWRRRPRTMTGDCGRTTRCSTSCSRRPPSLDSNTLARTDVLTHRSKFINAYEGSGQVAGTEAEIRAQGYKLVAPPPRLHTQSGNVTGRRC